MLVGGCSQEATPVAPSAIPSEIQLSETITSRDAFVLIQSNTNNPGFVIIDVRTAAEFNGGHIANAISLDYYSPDFKSVVGTLDRDSRYLVYCRTGIRGAAAAQIMRDLSFKQIQNLTGGLDQWIRDGYPTSF
jgi:rhodanese-related sulfurtransferase